VCPAPTLSEGRELMATLLPTRITQDPSDGYRFVPHLKTAEFDLRVSFDVLGGERIRARMTGSTVPTLRSGEYRADLTARPGDIRAAAARLCERWRTVFVEYQPTIAGRPVTGRTRPYTALVDLSGEPEGELRQTVAELARMGGSMLFDTLLGGDDERITMFRSSLAQALTDEGLRIRFDSSDLYLPWPMLCVKAEHLHESCAEADLSLDDLFTLFLGYRHQLEHAGDAFPWIPSESTAEPPMPAVSLNHDTTVGTRLQRVREVAAALTAGTKCTERTTYQDLVRDLGTQVLDDQLMYFWCHGVFAPNGAEPAQLVIRLTDQTPLDGYTVRELRTRFRRSGVINPFVMLNACYAGTASGDGERSFLGKELIDHGAQGVLGPRIAMPQAFAAEYAFHFIREYLIGGPEATAGRIVQHLAREFASRYRNPLGFAYALHSGMDSRLSRTSETGVA